MKMRLVMLGIFLFLSVLCVGLGIPFMQRKIGPNDCAGVRTPETLRDPELWYEANEYSGRWMIWIGILTGLLGLGLYFVRAIGDEAYTLGMSVVVTLILLFYTVKVLSYTKSLSRAKHDVAGETTADREWGHSLRVIGLVLAILVAMILVVTSIPLALGQVSPNPTSGFRVPETLNNPDIWYKVNAYAGKMQIAAGLLIVALAIVLYYVRRINNIIYLAICLGGGTLITILVAILSFAYLRSLTGG